MEMIFRHKSATAMLILLYGDFERANAIADGVYDLFRDCMRDDFEALDKNLYDRDRGLMSIFVPTYTEEDFTQKNLHEVIPRFVGFYKDI